MMSGKQHRSDPLGVPVFTDDVCISMTKFAWADFMAVVWNTIENTRKYSYQDFVDSIPRVGVKVQRVQKRGSRSA